MSLSIRSSLLFAFLAAFTIPEASASEAMGKIYPGPWLEPTGDVMVVLGRNKIKGCGEFYQKANALNVGEFLVACTRDGTNWTAYAVIVGTEQVTSLDETAIVEVGGPPFSN